MRHGASLQLGVQKYLYTGYFVIGCMVAYLAHQVGEKALGEGHDSVVTLVAILVGVVAVVGAWKNTKIRTLSQEIVEELAAVAWPTRQETYTATVVVVVTSVFAAVSIFLMDQFWNWFTDVVFR